MNPKDIIDYLHYFWPFRKTKWGLSAAVIPAVIAWVAYVIPHFQTNKQLFYILSFIFFACIMIYFGFWFIDSGRLIFPRSGYKIIFCLKAQGTNGNKHIQDSLSLLSRELDKLGLLNKFRIINVGQDVIKSQSRAHKYREEQDVDLIIWGEVFSGSKQEKEICNFKLSFTFKVPGSIAAENLQPNFLADVNIAVINRDWNIYEINSLPDTEKMSENLFEIIMFVVGLIYSQYLDFSEDSVMILESLFRLLEVKTSGEQAVIHPTENTLEISPTMLRKGRLLAILVNLYKNLGLYFVDSRNYHKGRFYLEKVKTLEKNIAVFSGLALCAFYLKDMTAAKTYTEEINRVERNNEIFLFNQAFFGIWEKNYDSALFYYGEVIKRERVVTGETVTKVITFLDERKSEYPDELAYDFAIGLLNYYYCQNKAGSHELRRFVKLAKRKLEYHKMVCFVKDSIFPKKRKEKKR